MTSLGYLPWTGVSLPGRTVLGIASAVGVFAMVYPAFVMGRSPAIALWNNSILPLLFVAYGLIDGIDLALAFSAALGQTYAIDVGLLETVEIALLILIVICLWAYLGLMSTSRVGTKEAARMLTKGELAFMFWGVVVVVGIAIPLGVGIYGYVTGGLVIGVSGIIGLLGLIGCLYFKHCILRAGVYDTLA